MWFTLYLEVLFPNWKNDVLHSIEEWPFWHSEIRVEYKQNRNEKIFPYQILLHIDLMNNSSIKIRNFMT